MTATPATTYEASTGMMSKQSGTLVPSATLNTLGAAVTVTPDAVNGAMTVGYLALVVASIGTETITLSATATYADGTTSSAITIASTANTNGTYAAAARDLGYVLKKDGTYIVSLAIKAKSSINTTTAVVSFEFAGTV